MSASVGGLMSQRNIATRIVSPGPAESNRVLARPSTVGSDGTVGGEVKQTSTPESAKQPDFPRAAAVSPDAPPDERDALSVARPSRPAASRVVQRRVRTVSHPRRTG